MPTLRPPSSAISNSGRSGGSLRYSRRKIRVNSSDPIKALAPVELSLVYTSAIWRMKRNKQKKKEKNRSFATTWMAAPIYARKHRWYCTAARRLGIKVLHRRATDLIFKRNTASITRNIRESGLACVWRRRAFAARILYFHG